MGDDKWELLWHLFAIVTEFVESAHDAAAKVQSARLTAQGYADAARDLHAAARVIASLAEAAEIIAENSATSPDSPP